MDPFQPRQLNRQKMMCQKCSFIYSPDYGDQESNIAPWTAFADIPEEWRCPICDSSKADFVPFENEYVSVEEEQ